MAMIRRKELTPAYVEQMDADARDTIELKTFTYRIRQLPLRLDITDSEQARYSFRWNDCTFIESPSSSSIVLHFSRHLVTISGYGLHTMMESPKDYLVHPSLWDALNAQSAASVVPSADARSDRCKQEHCISTIVGRCDLASELDAVARKQVTCCSQ